MQANPKRRKVVESTAGLTRTQRLALQLALEGSSLFITGKAGTGKSWTLLKIIEALREAGKRVMVTSTTGCAAVNVGGTTLYKAFGFPPKVVEEFARGGGREVRAKAHQRRKWSATDCIVIDEISMANWDLFEYTSQLGCSAADNAQQPFGGKQVILVGDFFQLNPVGKETKFAFETDPYRRLFLDNEAPGRTIVLETVFRQKDSPFLRAINRLRVGKVTDEDAKLFRSLDRALPSRGDLKPTILNPRVRGVDQHNASELARLSGREFKFEPTLTVPETVAAQNKKKRKCEADRKAILKNIQTAWVLKKGAQVMLTANLDLERGLCNGARGVVLGFKRDEEALGRRYHPVVRFDSVGSLLIREHTWSLKGSAESGEGGGTVRAIPLILAYAITIHKSQGQTIDYLDVDLRKLGTWREPGLVYTALSRARSAEGLRVRGFDAAMVVSNTAVRDFYASTPRCAA
jgi:ATP-dependent DNA helicase PIF1